MSDSEKSGVVHGVGFTREEGEYRPIYPINHDPTNPPKVVYLESPLKRYRYELKEVTEK